ncbi:Uncharacterized protein AC513_4433 [Pseudomonas savastanoi pv. phaseolicola]|nr:Uncharacterized protein AC513_4433 [Pseudomonas savastanoi pv. phaseolicola]
MSMKLHKVLSIGGTVMPLVNDDVRLDLKSPGRATFTIKAGVTVKGLVTFDIGYNEAVLQRHFIGYVERCTATNVPDGSITGGGDGENAGQNAHVVGAQITLGRGLCGQAFKSPASLRSLVHLVTDQCCADQGDSQQVWGWCASLWIAAAWVFRLHHRTPSSGWYWGAATPQYRSFADIVAVSFLWLQSCPAH